MVAAPLPSPGERIYDCMVDEVYKKGYHGASLRSLAKSVGLTMSTLYHYYPSKEHILVAIMTRTLTDLRASIDAAISGAPNPTDQIEAMIRAHISFHISRSYEAWVADTEFKSLTGDDATEMGQLRDDYERLFVDVLSRGTDLDEFNCPDAQLTAKAILAMCTEVALWFRPGGRLTSDDVADNYINLVFHGVNNSPPKIERSRQ